MSTEEKGIHKMLRKSSGCTRKSKQSSYRGTQIAQRTLLPTKDRMRSVQCNKNIFDDAMYRISYIAYGVSPEEQWIKL